MNVLKCGASFSDSKWNLRKAKRAEVIRTYVSANGFPGLIIFAVLL